MAILPCSAGVARRCGFFPPKLFAGESLHTLPYGFKKFSMSDPLPACARWKDHMPASRDPAAYRLYIEARKVWRSKIEWQLSHDEAMRILTDVKTSADAGDWGARALLAHFYLEGLGPLESNEVLKPDSYKAVEIARMAAKAMQPWGLYDLGVAHEHGYGGAHYDVDLAWAYYLRAAQLGSPEAQMTLAQAYSDAGRLGDEKTMQQCAYQQGHGPAAYELGMTARIHKRFMEAITIYQEGVKFGNSNYAAALWLLFDDGHWTNAKDEEKSVLKLLGVTLDPERSSRYKTVSEVPAPLPKWSDVDSAVEPESNGRPTY
ncbi:hypothetical protein BA896_004200 [Janthinobacterium lividum]|uniref:Sel1 repeat family protein n=1 Tax=Janthinobacterium lividum TaxID=29581 RepID=A0A1E8PQ12_9BURK|nr:hypothetical protein BA896_004200 [Janthinobacterium lividum]